MADKNSRGDQFRRNVAVSSELLVAEFCCDGVDLGLSYLQLAGECWPGPGRAPPE